MANAKQLLLKLGFGLARYNLEQAIREFQIYSRMPSVAVEGKTGTFATYYARRLLGLTNPYQNFSITVNGYLDKNTLDLMKIWDGLNYRCPVVVDAWSVDRRTGRRMGSKPVYENITYTS